MKIRHHGDLHLGQMLCVKDDIFILDFEGEPRRIHCRAPAQGAGGARCGRRDPLDRLFGDRGARSALKLDPDDRGQLARALDGWREHCGAAAFLDAYRCTAVAADAERDGCSISSC